MNDALLASPRRMLGRYEILGEIAQGAMGVVYKARDPMIDRLVAIKTIALGLSDAETEAYERRFFREARSAGRLNHPNVVTIHDVGKSDDVAYIAMEFLDGQSLREILDSGVVLPPQRVADIAAEIADGLAFAHDNGVVHRDVKPANIMVLSSGAVKITDFGIALLPTGTRTLSGNAFGSPRYTSPEQVMGRQVDGRSDIFSLGATLYEMLTGQSPFQGGDLNTILKQVLSEPTPPPSSRNPRLPRAFDHIVAKALAKDPADRYQTAEAMAHDLRQFDAAELDTAGPGLLPALEHPTTPFNVRELVPLADEPLAAAASLTSDPPVTSSSPPWWRTRTAVGGAIGVIVLALAAVAYLGLRGSPPAPSVAKGDATRSMGAIAPVPPRREEALPAVAGPVSAAADVGSTATAPSAPTPATTGAPSTPAPTNPAAAPAVAAPSGTPPSPAGGVPAPTATPSPAPAAAVATAAASPATGSAPAVAPTAAGTPPADGAAPPAAPPKAAGRVAFAVTPWGEVYVDGRKRGISPPMQELRLAPGKHVVEIRNTTFAPYRETIDVKADGTVRIKHKFQ